MHGARARRRRESARRCPPTRTRRPAREHPGPAGRGVRRRAARDAAPKPRRSARGSRGAARSRRRDDRREAAHRRSDHRSTGGLGLGGDQPERLVVGRYGDHRRRGVPQRELRRRDRRHEADDVRDPQPVGELGQCLGVLETACPDGPPTTGTTSRDRRSGVSAEQQRDGAQQHVGRLERLEPPGEEDDVGVRGQVEPTPRVDGVAGTEHRQVDAGVDDLDAAGIGVVQVDQLLGLGVGAGDQHVGGLDDLLLADDPCGRLGGVADGERVVLDLGHRVHRVHQRDPPAVAREGADLAGEPVVGVHEVVVAERLGGLGAQHLAGEHAELAGQLALAQPLERAGMDVVHGDPVARRLHRVVARGRGPGEDVDLDACGSQPTRQLDHVDVHARPHRPCRVGPAARCAR